MNSQKSVLLILFFGLLIAHPTQQALVEGEPLVQQFIMPSQSWKFIEIGNLSSGQVVDFEWQATDTIQGKQVSREQFLTLQAASPSERAQYFETLDYFEGKHDYGRATADSSGKIWFVFYNPRDIGITLTISLTLRNITLSPWEIGLITSVGVVIVLGFILWLTYYLRRKMLEEQLARDKSPAERYFEM